MGISVYDDGCLQHTQVLLYLRCGYFSKKGGPTTLYQGRNRGGVGAWSIEGFLGLKRGGVTTDARRVQNRSDGTYPTSWEESSLFSTLQHGISNFLSVPFFWRERIFLHVTIVPDFTEIRQLISTSEETFLCSSHQGQL